MRRLFDLLPGPMVVRIAIVIVVLMALLVGLFYLFEYAGDLLDTGGVVGPQR
jgi:hypothetical protein